MPTGLPDRWRFSQHLFSSTRRAKSSSESAWSAWSDLGVPTSPGPTDVGTSENAAVRATPPRSLRERTHAERPTVLAPLSTPPPTHLVKGKGAAGRPSLSPAKSPAPSSSRAPTPLTFLDDNQDLPPPSGRRSVLSFSPRRRTSLSASSIGATSFRSGFSALSSGITKKARGRVSMGGRTAEALTWAQLRQELEGYLAEAQVVERCLTEVSFDEDKQGLALKEIWDEQIWALASALSPPLPAVLYPHPATGLLPLLTTLRSRLSFLALLPPAYVTSPDELEPLLDQATSALAAARAIEAVVEVVARKGLVKFELVDAGEDGGDWRGEMKGRTGGGDRWRGWARNNRN